MLDNFKVRLKEIEGVEKVLEEDNVLSITINSKFTLSTALSILESSGIVMKKITYDDIKLEDVFLSLTGKTLRN